MEEILFKWIPTVGFPIAVCIYILVRQEPKLDKLTTAITTLVPLVKQETQNGKEIKEALVDFRVEVSKLNGRAK